MSGSHGALRPAMFFFIILALAIAACDLPRLPIGQNPAATASATSFLEPTIPPALTPTPAAKRTLTVCLGQEPNTLYPYGGPNDAALSVLAAIQDGPVDTVGYDLQRVILTKLPTLADGDAKLVPVDVKTGSKIVDADGTLTALAAGTRLRPSSCRADDCVIRYDGVSPLKMDQLVVTFHMLPGVTWSDGTPVTADDSVYAYSLAVDPATPSSHFLTDRTQTYEASGSDSTQWWGVPGYLDQTFGDNFWAPAPKHLWSQYKPAQLPQIDIASREPAGWGPYKIEKWTAGDHIELSKNPYYFRASSGLPKFDQLIFRFVPDPQTAVSDLIGGQCDLLDPSIPLDGQVGLLQSMTASKQLKAVFVTTPVMEQLALGIKPSSYDNGYNPGTDRPDLFGDRRVRQALALCLDRQKIVDGVLHGLSSVPSTYVPGDDPLYNNGVTQYAYNAEAGSQLLEQVGWHQVGDDPTAPRQAFGVPGVPDGTPLVLDYVTTDATQRLQVGAILSDSLAQCGIKANVRYLDSANLYAPGPQGILFGRSFELAELAVLSNGLQPPCEWYTSAEVPTQANQWLGINIGGYGNPAYDAACQSGHQSLPDESAYADAYHQTEAIFSEDLPVIPLYWRVEVAAGRKDLCNYVLDPTAANSLWNIAALDYGSAGCQ